MKKTGWNNELVAQEYIDLYIFDPLHTRLLHLVEMLERAQQAYGEKEEGVLRFQRRESRRRGRAVQSAASHRFTPPREQVELVEGDVGESRSRRADHHQLLLARLLRAEAAAPCLRGGRVLPRHALRRPARRRPAAQDRPSLPAARQWETAAHSRSCRFEQASFSTARPAPARRTWCDSALLRRDRPSAAPRPHPGRTSMHLGRRCATSPRGTRSTSTSST